MNDMKHFYIAPEVAKLRVFLEEGIAKASILVSSAASIQQTNWTGVTDEIAGAGTDTQGDLWMIY
jgi:hypothetical protein